MSSVRGRLRILFRRRACKPSCWRSLRHSSQWVSITCCARSISPSMPVRHQDMGPGWVRLMSNHHQVDLIGLPPIGVTTFAFLRWSSLRPLIGDRSPAHASKLIGVQERGPVAVNDFQIRPDATSSSLRDRVSGDAVGCQSDTSRRRPPRPTEADRTGSTRLSLGDLFSPRLQMRESRSRSAWHLACRPRTPANSRTQ